MYTEDTIVDLIQVLEDGQIQVREATRVLKDGVPIAKQYRRYVLDPGVHHVSDIKDSRLQSVATVLWTPSVVESRNAFLAASDTRTAFSNRPVDNTPLQTGTP